MLLEFQGKQYIADVFGENTRIDNIITPLSVLQKLPQTPLPSHFSFQKQHDKSRAMEFFDNQTAFTDYLHHRPTRNIKLTFRPKIDETHYDDVEIVINDEAILCTIGERSYTLFIDKKFTLPKKLSKTQVIDYIMQHAEGDKKAKQEIATYINMVRKKINPQKLYEVFQKTN